MHVRGFKEQRRPGMFAVVLAVARSDSSSCILLLSFPDRDVEFESINKSKRLPLKYRVKPNN